MEGAFIKNLLECQLCIRFEVSSLLVLVVFTLFCWNISKL